jgi:CRP-like cAMP-binding protein
VPANPRTPAGERVFLNEVLLSLTQSDLDLLTPGLQPINLPLRKQLEVKSRRIEHVYFFDRGLASVVTNGSGHSEIEIGIIGREGVTGLAVIMGGDRSPHETYVQLAGSGHRLAVPLLRSAMAQSASLQQRLLRVGYAFTVQTAQTAMANGRHKIEERLARWLLMAHDRVDGDDLSLTHEFLSRMLGVRRPGVTVALKGLEMNGLIKAKRGGILIIDRTGLEESSNGAYIAAEE